MIDVYSFTWADISFNIIPGKLTGSNTTIGVDMTQKGLPNDGFLVLVEISSNMKDFTSSAVFYRYHPFIQVLCLTISHGPFQSGKNLILMGSSIPESSHLNCCFGNKNEISVPAIYFNTTHVSCVSPRLFLDFTDENDTRTVSIPVFISVNGITDVSRTDALDGAIFTYEKPVTLSGIFPSSGSIDGVYVIDTLEGPFFEDISDDIQCKFGDKTVSGSWPQPNKIESKAPKVSSAGLIALKVTTIRHDFTPLGLTFVYYHTPMIKHIFPIMGPGRRAGISVMIHGQDFVNASSLSCRLYCSLASGAYVIPSKIICISPPISEQKQRPAFLFT